MIMKFPKKRTKRVKHPLKQINPGTQFIRIWNGEESIRVNTDFKFRTGQMANKRKWCDSTFGSTHLA